ncbi:MAG TPA: MlaE family lipid ABC transporter permease subunit [Stellaceae bacterium]|nr:MlaE family lipid ABC transporter permease subunit [Stellaceae bacterium]
MTAAWIEPEGDADTLVLRAGGEWSLAGAAALDRRLGTLRLPPARRVSIDLGALETLDTAGAWLLLRLERSLKSRGSEVQIDNLAETLAPLLGQVERGPEEVPRPPRRPVHHGLRDFLAYIGEGTLDRLVTTAGVLSFLGLVVVTVGRAFVTPRRIRVTSLVAHMERSGFSAMPIVGLLSFLIGIVTAYQGADQLRRFGAEILTVDLLAVGFLRELGAMLTAIIVAGRSGSAFTAELGAMEVREEIDALKTIGLDPVEVLVLPRLFGLMLTLPLLTFFANLMGLLGGALLCWLVLGIALPVFTQELRDAVSLWSVWLGIIKAPFFAIAVSLIGCYEGFSVERSAESVGRHATRSVVESIFTVIVIDAAFSILFSWLQI